MLPFASQNVPLISDHMKPIIFVLESIDDIQQNGCTEYKRVIGGASSLAEAFTKLSKGDPDSPDVYVPVIRLVETNIITGVEPGSPSETIKCSDYVCCLLEDFLGNTTPVSTVRIRIPIIGRVNNVVDDLIPIVPVMIMGSGANSQLFGLDLIKNNSGGVTTSIVQDRA